MTPEEISLLKDILLIIMPIITVVIGGYIGHIFGIKRGKREKELEYDRIKKSLRDKKFLEGRISGYLELYQLLYNLNVYSRNLTSGLKGEDDREKKYFVEKIADLILEKMDDIVPKTYFYSNPNVTKQIERIIQDILVTWYKIDKISTSSKDGGITEQQEKQIQSFIDKTDISVDNFRKLAREDLGFKEK